MDHFHTSEPTFITQGGSRKAEERTSKVDFVISKGWQGKLYIAECSDVIPADHKFIVFKGACLTTRGVVSAEIKQIILPWCPQHRLSQEEITDLEKSMVQEWALLKGLDQEGKPIDTVTRLFTMHFNKMKKQQKHNSF